MAESVRTNEPLGYKQTGIAKPKTEAEIKCELLTEQLLKAEDENR